MPGGKKKQAPISKPAEPQDCSSNGFNIEIWGKSQGLSSKSITTLIKQDLASEESLKVFANLAQDSNYAHLGLTLGQQLMFKNALLPLIKKQNPDQGAAETGIPPLDPPLNMQTCHDKDPGTPASIQEIFTNSGKTFDQLHVSPNLGEGEPICKQGKWENHSLGDPRIMLTMKASKNKATHITQFLSEKTKKRRSDKSRKEIFLGGIGEEKISIRSDDIHPYAGLTIGEWGAANVRLMNSLLTDGTLLRDQIEYYMAYTAHVFDALDIYEWSSILEFDFQYRELQAEYQFPWGTPMAHLESKLLLPRSRKLEPRLEKNKAGKKLRKPDHSQDCRLFLTSGCPFGKKCIFKHPATPDQNNQKNS